MTETSPHPSPMPRHEAATIGFLARYGNAGTRAAYELDLQILFNWCAAQGLDPFDDVTRPYLELFARHLETDRGNSPVSVHRRLCTIKCFYRIAEVDGYVKVSPATHLRLPRIYKDESKTLGLDRAELGALVYAARASSPSDGALIVMLGLLGLRVSEACGVRIEHTHGEDRGHRTLALTGKGSRRVTIPLAIPVQRVMDLAAGDRTEGWLVIRADGSQMNRDSAARVVTRLAKKAGIHKKISPHSLRHSFITACLDAGVPLRDVQIAARHSDVRMTVFYDRARGNLDRHANYLVAGFIAGAV